MDFEAQLKRTLARQEPPPGFAGRVMARITTAPPQTSSAKHWRIAAAVMLTATLTGWGAHTLAERREGERARDEVMLALQIAGEKVHHAQTQVREVGSRR